MGKHIRFDWAIKRLLRQKSNFGILEGFLSELLMQDIYIQEIIESEGNKQTENDKFNRVDILVKSSKDELMLVEVQNEREHDYFHRMNYAQAKLITEHIYESDKYKEIKKVFSINIVYFELGHGDDYIYVGKTQFKGVHTDELLNLSNLQKKTYTSLKEVSDIFATYYIIKVNNFDDIAKDTLDEWIYFLKNSIIKDEFKAKGLQEAKEKMRKDNLTGIEKEAYDAFIKYQRIREGEMETARFDGQVAAEKKFIPIIEQKEQQLQKERQKAELKEQELKKEQKKAELKEQELQEERLKAKEEHQKLVKTIRNMKAKGMSNIEIAEITGETIEDISTRTKA